MNKLSLETRVQILTLLCEGSSMRSISRLAGVSINTVTKLLVDAGTACTAFHDERVRGVQSQRIQCDKIWSFSYAKGKNAKWAKAPQQGAGDVWTWTGIDADSKLIVSWHVGDRTTNTGTSFMADLKARLANKVQLSTDGHRAYLAAVAEVDLDADYAMLVKIFEPELIESGRYSPPKCVGAKTTIRGNPDPDHISTSFVERQNLTMRMSMRRFTRLTNAFSKKFENHCHALALYFFHYNFCRVHKTLGATPAMGSGVSDRIMKMTDICAYLDALQRPNFAALTRSVGSKKFQTETLPAFGGDGGAQ
jgi:IS1 family transposase